MKKLPENRAIRLKFGEEIMVMAGGKLGSMVFDQNRIYADLSFELNPAFSLEVGYVNWFQFDQSGEYLEKHIIRTTILHQLDFSLKKRRLKEKGAFRNLLIPLGGFSGNCLFDFRW